MEVAQVLIFVYYQTSLISNSEEEIFKHQIMSNKNSIIVVQTKGKRYAKKICKIWQYFGKLLGMYVTQLHN